MAESSETGAQGKDRRVRVAWFPTYPEARELLRVLVGVPEVQVTGLQRTFARLRGTPQSPVDWKDPGSWIDERLSGEDHTLAKAIWEESGKTFNPRYIAGSWMLSQAYDLLVEGADGKLEATRRGREFIEQVSGSTEAFLDVQEALVDLLGIVAHRGPARPGVLVEPWAAFLKRHSGFNSPSTIRDTLSRRLKNLLDRNLVNRQGYEYAITNTGLDYLKRVGPQNGTSKVPAGIKRYAEEEDGRTILATFADSIEFAHALKGGQARAGQGWVALFDRRRRDMRLYVGSTLMMVVEGSREMVEVTLLPGQLEDGQQAKMQSAHVLHEYAYPEGAKRYLLSWKDFVEQWESMKKAHQEVMRQVVMRPPRGSAHRTDAIEFLNQALGRDLPNPLYVDTGPVGPVDGKGGLSELAHSLRNDGLLFSQETVANYILALQAKRFAILTGISGTGKTKIAKAVAKHFQPTVPKRVPTKIPDDAVEIEVRLSHLKHSLLTVPQVMVARLSLLGPDAPLADRRIRIRYPGGKTALTHYHRGSTELYLSGEFKKWYHFNLELGDRIWLRVLEGDTPDSDGLEIGRLESKSVKQPLDNYEVIPVRPDWVDNRGLLGYLNPLTNEYSTTPFLNLLLRARVEEERAEAAGENPHPFFVILDEMNLARVEHYFSDFLSALESGEDIPLHENEAIESGESESGPQVPRKLKVPANVLFTGTVNVDETTYMFSPKVLDRAFTIEFDQVDLEGFTRGEASEEPSGLDLDGVEDSLDLLRSGSSGGDWKPSREDWVKFRDEAEGHQEALLQLHGVLEEQHRHFGYRVANEIARFVNLAREQAADPDAGADAAFDLALLQKVLPKFHGTQQELESLLEQIFRFAVHGGDHGSKGKQSVKVDEWKVVAGRLIATSASQASSGDADPDTENAKADEAAANNDVAAPVADAETPAYPRTGAKVLRMIQRLRDRGFTSFIE